MDKVYTVFVYGTLRKGHEGFDKFLKDARFLGYGKVKGVMYHTMSGYPAVILDEDGEDIKGEVYLVDRKTIENLRKYEGVSSLLTCYDEAVLKIFMDDGTLRMARGFVVSGFNRFFIRVSGKKVVGGDWSFYLENPPKKSKKWLIIYLWLIANLFVFAEMIYALHK